MTRSEKQEIIQEQIQVGSNTESFSHLTSAQVLQEKSQPSQNLCQECKISQFLLGSSPFIGVFVVLNFGRTLDKYIAHFSQVVEGFGISEQSKKVAELADRLRSARATMET